MKKKLGDFTGLAKNYSQFRPGYASMVGQALLGLVEKRRSEIDFVDVGAGTGIWTRIICDLGVNSVTAIEPNNDMREHGIKDSAGTGIAWAAGNGEDTKLPSNSADILTMASSFHWVDFERGIQEFTRVLRSGGIFSALWNPRHIESNPLLVEIEAMLNQIAPNIKRVSSGNSEFTQTLMDRLIKTDAFSDVIYLEGTHTIKQSPEEYIGVWWSVNDIRAQAGEEKFNQFMDYVEQRVKGLDFIETTYKTKAWAARVK
ncbi:class I SAM-dependent methyltransferase [Pseudoalteromonas piscicida]|uniref:Methyltransferase n=1 Tax=Pseudoalteromonas piscicida TaxID=43662 RepID=A0A2A5JVH0_PSEO7|nr:class I SAM-dependent methyltransferase [Pseudoalteromonas piscicida]PCK33408.1 methyltransferase [Pseudoalteromonas piscicida]